LPFRGWALGGLEDPSISYEDKTPLAAPLFPGIIADFPLDTQADFGYADGSDGNLTMWFWVEPQVKVRLLKQTTLT
jgi:hypothetical protein